jgi:hypothetical protein
VLTWADARFVKSETLRVDDPSVKLQRCPYDGTPLDVDAFSGGSYLLTCTSCTATWEAHNSLVRRTSEPDWDRARSARAARANSIRMDQSLSIPQ